MAEARNVISVNDQVKMDLDSLRARRKMTTNELLEHLIKCDTNLYMIFVIHKSLVAIESKYIHSFNDDDKVVDINGTEFYFEERYVDERGHWEAQDLMIELSKNKNIKIMTSQESYSIFINRSPDKKKAGE